jgi:hypothetical protein
LIVIRLHVLNDRNRDDATASGTMGRPERRAMVTMPIPATRAGPGGTSAVMENVAPPLSRRTAVRSA